MTLFIFGDRIENITYCFLHRKDFYWRFGKIKASSHIVSHYICNAFIRVILDYFWKWKLVVFIFVRTYIITTFFLCEKCFILLLFILAFLLNPFYHVMLLIAYLRIVSNILKDKLVSVFLFCFVISIYSVYLFGYLLNPFFLSLFCLSFWKDIYTFIQSLYILSEF